MFKKLLVIVGAVGSWLSFGFASMAVLAGSLTGWYTFALGFSVGLLLIGLNLYGR